MYCSQCGRQAASLDRYCISCGAALNRVGTIGDAPPSDPRTGAATAAKNEKTYLTLGWIFFGLSFFFVPMVFGAGALVMGILVLRGGNQPKGILLIVLAVAGAVIGTFLGAMVGAMMGSYFSSY